MEMFVIQTLLWLVLAFALGALLGRFVKGKVCNRSITTPISVSTDQKVQDPSYLDTADKLANRDKRL